MLWANATSLPLFARYFLGEVFEFGKLYTIFDYDVYLGEALLSIVGLLLFAFFCSRHKKIVVHSQISMIRQVFARSIVVVVVVFAFSLLILLNNYNLMSKRAASGERRAAARQGSGYGIPGRSDRPQKQAVIYRG